MFKKGCPDSDRDPTGGSLTGRLERRSGYSDGSNRRDSLYRLRQSLRRMARDKEALAEIKDYETIVTARTNKMTIFITGWRKWANWRTAKFTVDCVSLVPVNPAGYPNSAAAAAAPPPAPTPSVEVVQPASMTEGSPGTAPAQPQSEPGATEGQLPTTGAPAESTSAQPQPEPALVQQQTETIPVQTQPDDASQTSTENPATQPQAETAPLETQPETTLAQPQTETAQVATQPETAPAEESASIIPTSGGILENTSNGLLFGAAAVIVILGLVGAGIWNMRRR